MRLARFLRKHSTPSIFLTVIAASVGSVAGQDLKVVANPQLRSVVNAGTQNSGRPPTLSPIQKVQGLQKLPGSRLVQASSLTSPITLNVSNSYIKGRASLFIILPVALMPDEN